MKSIYLPNCGESAIVDDEDYDRVVGLGTWRLRIRNGRRSDVRHTMPDNRPVTLHQFILGAESEPVDHKSGDVLDNRKENLRLCGARDNNRNKGMVQANTSGLKGVSPSGRIGKPWVAFIRPGDGSGRNLGRFATKEEAARAYDAAAIKHFGEFARTNVTLGLLPEMETSNA